MFSHLLPLVPQEKELGDISTLAGGQGGPGGAAGVEWGGLVGREPPGVRRGWSGVGLAGGEGAAGVCAGLGGGAGGQRNGQLAAVVPLGVPLHAAVRAWSLPAGWVPAAVPLLSPRPAQPPAATGRRFRRTLYPGLEASQWSPFALCPSPHPPADPGVVEQLIQLRGK